MTSTLQSIRHVPAEVFLSAFIVLVLVLSLFTRRERNTPQIFYPIGIAGLLVTIIIEAMAAGSTLFEGQTHAIFHGLLRADALASFFKLVVEAAAVVFMLMSYVSRETARRFNDAMEYVLLTLALTLGMMFLAASANVLMLYVALELVSFTSYLLTDFVDRDEKNTEAAVKYLLYGGVASGVMIFGFSLLYGLTGTLDFGLMQAALATGAQSPLLLGLAIVFVLAGLGFKIAAFPFHLWCPDVYEGAATAFTAFLSVGPKVAGFAAIFRVFFQVLAGPSGEPGMLVAVGGVDWPLLIAIISALTMTVGNLSALPQRNIKRMLAYSSISHAGYVLMGVAAASSAGLLASAFYLAVYLLMNLGAFLVIVLIANEFFTEHIEGYEGLGWKGGKGAFLASMLTVCLFSLTGIPPFAGFVGKVYLLVAVIERGPVFYWLAAVAVLNTLVSVYYYARVVRLMFLSSRERGGALTPLQGHQYVSYPALGLLGALTVAFGVYWAPLDRLGRLVSAIII